MSTAIIVTIVVLAFLAGTLYTLRKNAKTGMPSQDVLDRATQRARELESQERPRKSGVRSQAAPACDASSHPAASTARDRAAVRGGLRA